MITLADFWMGRDLKYRNELKPFIIDNAKVTVERTNKLLNAFYAVHPDAVSRHVNSGWRPQSVNDVTPNAARTSLHITGEAVDLSDGDGELGRWCRSPAGLTILQQIGLWLESPDYTRRYVHVQTKSPRSGNRVFIPR